MNALECATGIIKKLVKAGYIAYFAGGWVRDRLLKHDSSDIDIATDAPPQVILDLFPHTILVGLSFGVVIVVVQGYQFEVASFRRDVNYFNGRKPDRIELSTPQEDAQRRDITINGMFYDPLTETIHDFVGGVADLKKGIIRAIGDPNERFVEDRLRMIRTIRFACRFGFAIDPETQEAIKENAPTLFPAVAQERIWQEFNKMAATGHFDHALIEMHRLGILPVIFPSLNTVHLNTIKQQVAAFSRFPENCPVVLRLLTLFPDVDEAGIAELCQKLRMSNQEIDMARFAVRYRTLMGKPELADKVDRVHFYANPLSQPALEAYAATFSVDEQKSLLLAHRQLRLNFAPHIARIQNRNPVITSSLLMANGIPSGIRLGHLLKQGERIAIEKDLHTPEEILKELLH